MNNQQYHLMNLNKNNLLSGWFIRCLYWIVYIDIWHYGRSNYPRVLDEYWDITSSIEGSFDTEAICDISLGRYCNSQVPNYPSHLGIAAYQKIQDRRWNADKPSAALDPYIPIWLTTSPAYQRPANFWKSFFFQALKGNCEKCCIFRLNWWGPILSSHSLILHIQIITYTLSISL